MIRWFQGHFTSTAQRHRRAQGLRKGETNKQRRAASQLRQSANCAPGVTATPARPERPLPIGLCYTDDQHIVLDPHLQVQATIRAVFATFTQTGSACATVRQFRQQ
jgi:hypothetical protein